MRGSIAPFLVALTACSFTGKGAPLTDPPTGDAVGDIDAPTMPTPDAAIDAALDAFVQQDAPPPPPRLRAASNTVLYEIDLATSTATMIGTIPVTRLDGLGFDGTNLLGLDANSANLVTIDPVTAAVATTTPVDKADLGGLTASPTGTIYAADLTSLYTVSAAGHATLVGTFSTGYQFATDLAWVANRGLFVTLRALPLTPKRVDLVRIDPATGKTIAVIGTGYDNVNGLSGFGGDLLGLSTGGNIYRIDPTTGTSTFALMNGPSFTEAAQ